MARKRFLSVGDLLFILQMAIIQGDWIVRAHCETAGTKQAYLKVGMGGATLAGLSSRWLQTLLQRPWRSNLGMPKGGKPP